MSKVEITTENISDHQAEELSKEQPTYTVNSNDNKKRKIEITNQNDVLTNSMAFGLLMIDAYLSIDYDLSNENDRDRKRNNHSLIENVIVNNYEFVCENIAYHLEHSPDFMNETGYSLLYKAIFNDNITILEALLKHIQYSKTPLDPSRLAVNPKDGLSLLCYLFDIKRYETIRTVLKYGIDPNIIGLDSEGEPNTCLLLAIQNDNVDMIKTLLEYKADPNLPRGIYPNDTPLMHACGKENLKLVKLLLDHGADPNVLSTIHSVSMGDNMLFRMVDVYETTPLAAACYEWYVELAEVLLDNGADVDKKNNYNETPLRTVIEQDYDDADDADNLALCHKCVRLLLERGADVSDIIADDIVDKDSPLGKLIYAAKDNKPLLK